MINLNIVNPNGDNVIDEVDQVEIKALEGNLTILENHVPFISLIKNGYIKYKEKTLNINDGVIHFSKNNLYVTYFK